MFRFTMILRYLFVLILVIGFLVWHFLPTEQIIVGSAYKTSPVDDVGTLKSAAGGSGTETENTDIDTSISADSNTLPEEEDSLKPITDEAEAKIDISTLPVKIDHDVPFVTQAPEAQWSDKRFQDACEEASILMAYQWVGGDKELGAKEATAALEEIFKVQVPLFGGDVIDTSTEDTALLMKEFFGYNATRTENVTKEGLIQHLAKGRIIITPTDGRKLKNKYFSGDGPERHMTVVVGYDQKKEEFIVNDPGTRRGKDYRYDMNLFMNAIRDYPTGNKEPITQNKKQMLVIAK